MVEVMRDDDDVVSFRGQPETFVWREASGRRRQYTPDFLVSLADRRMVYREVKPLEILLGDPSLKGRILDIRRECAERDATFEIWTEDEIDGIHPTLRPATCADRKAYDRSCSSLVMRLPRWLETPLDLTLSRLNLTNVRAMDGAVLGISALTNVLMRLEGPESSTSDRRTEFVR